MSKHPYTSERFLQLAMSKCSLKEIQEELNQNLTSLSVLFVTLIWHHAEFLSLWGKSWELFFWRYSIVIWFPSLTPLMCLINISTYLKSIENVPKWYICISLISETVYQKRLLHHLMYVLHWLNWYIAHKCLYAFWLVNKSLNLKDWQWKSDWQRDTRLVILWDKECLSWLKICNSS